VQEERFQAEAREIQRQTESKYANSAGALKKALEEKAALEARLRERESALQHLEAHAKVRCFISSIRL
jgi:chaperonin cofactor prefoldin